MKRDKTIFLPPAGTRLTFLEYLMICVASSVFPEVLLNSEGQNRG